MSIKNEKRLTRGLADISAFFFSHSTASTSPKEKEPILMTDQILRSSPPAEAAKENMLSEVHCFAIHPLQAHQGLRRRSVFLDAVKMIFSDVFFLSFSANRAVDSPAPDSVRDLVLPPFQIYDILHPRLMTTEERAPIFNPEKHMAFFLEPKSMFEFRTDLFQLLDHVILHVSAASPDSILAAYQTLSACLQRDPTLHFSLLIDASPDEEVAAVIFERFAGITSKFLGCEVDFLGWMNDNSIQLNRELLLGPPEIGQAIRAPLKIQLVQLLSEEMLLEPA